MCEGLKAHSRHWHEASVGRPGGKRRRALRDADGGSQGQVTPGLTGLISQCEPSPENFPGGPAQLPHWGWSWSHFPWRHHLSFQWAARKALPITHLPVYWSQGDTTKRISSYPEHYLGRSAFLGVTLAQIDRHRICISFWLLSNASSQSIEITPPVILFLVLFSFFPPPPHFFPLTSYSSMQRKIILSNSFIALWY